MEKTPVAESDSKSASADSADLAEALDRDRFDMISELLALVSKFSAAGSLAADCGDVTEVAVRTRQVVLSTREACLVIGTLGRAETAP